MALLGNIQEPFTGTATPTGWTEFTGGSATFTYGSTGAQVNFPASTTSSTDGDINFAATNDLTSSFGRLNVLGVSGAAATHTDCVFRIRQNSTNYYTMFYEAGTLFFSKVVAGSQTNIASVAHSLTTHAWWQIRHSGASVYGEFSNDGKTWTQLGVDPTSITITAVDILIGGLCFGVDANPTPFKFRYYNYPQPGTTTSTSSTSVSSTSTSASTYSTSSTSSSISSTSTSQSTSSTSSSISSTSSSTSSTSSSTSSTSQSSTSSSTSISSTSSSISSTSTSSTSQSSTSSSTSISSTSSSFSSTSSSISSTSASTSSTSFSSTSSSSSTSSTTLPPPNYDFTYQDSLTLPTTGADLLNRNNYKQYSNELGDDGDYSIQYGSEYIISNYKRTNTNNTDVPSFTWRGRSTQSSVTSAMIMQIYNVNSAVWETKMIHNLDPADTDVSCTISQTTNISNYYDSSNIVTFRTYQQVI